MAILSILRAPSQIIYLLKLYMSLYSEETLNWGALIFSSLTVLGAIGNVFCRGSEEGTCSSVNVYGVWLTAILSMFSLMAILSRPTNQAYNSLIRFGLPTLAFSTALILSANAGASRCEDSAATMPVGITWGGAILSILTLLMLGYDNFKFGIQSVGPSFGTPMGL
jgi:hypothetical protein